MEKVEELHYPPLPDLIIPEPQRIVLDNGLVVLFMEDHELPLVGVTALIRTGSRLESEEKIGLASLTGTVLRTGGTNNRSGDELDEYLEGKAAVIETAIGDTSGTASMSSLAEDFPDVLKVFAEVLRFPVIDPEKLMIAKNQMMAGISRQNDDPDGILSREFKKLIYGKEIALYLGPDLRHCRLDNKRGCDPLACDLLSSQSHHFRSEWGFPEGEDP